MGIPYSIIIPHRDSADFLAVLLKTIPARDDIQVIVVDNSSIKMDPGFLGGAGKSNVLLLYSDPEKGAGHARNVGLEKAIGRWIIFADADDFFVGGAFNIFDKYKRSESDVIYFCVTSYYSDTREKANREKTYNKMVMDFYNKRSFENEDILKFKTAVPWGKMIRRQLIKNNNILFDEVIASNDIMFSAKIGYFAKKIEVDPSNVYCVSIRKGSLTKSRSKEVLFSRYCAMIKYNIFMRNIGKPTLQYRILSYTVQSLQYGFFETLKYIKIAFKNKINIFFGISNLPEMALRWNEKRKEEKRDRYIVKY